jgi:hypothetical protein
MATTWTRANIIAKVQDDLDLHEETVVTPDDIGQYIESAVDDAEEIIIDTYSDHFLTYEDLSVTEGDTTIDFPDDIYEGRIRGLYYSESGFTSGSPSGDGYKVKKMPFERVMNSATGDAYTYRILNSTSTGQKFHIFPAIEETSSIQWRLWYIRKAKRLDDDDDVLDNGIRVQYVLAHVKKAIAAKLGDPLVEIFKTELDKQEQTMKRSIGRLTDDDEDVYLEPDDRALAEAYVDELY